MTNLSKYTNGQYNGFETSKEILAAIEEFAQDDILVNLSVAHSIWAGNCAHIDGIALIIAGRAWEIANNEQKQNDDYEIPETFNWGSSTVEKSFS